MPRSTDIIWLTVAGATIIACMIVLALLSHRFGYDYNVAEMPILTLVGVLISAGVAFLAAAWFTAQIAESQNGIVNWPGPLVVVVLVGAAARMAFAFSDPMLEDDYQRYLLDGAVTAAGHSPYAIAPAELEGAENPGLKSVAAAAREVLSRVNHPQVRTIYPPGAQAFFVLAHWMKPFSLGAWRAVVLLSDAATFALLIGLLRLAGRPLVWSSLYWWNPIVIKELANSVHMEAVLMPVVLAAIWFAARRRPWAASLAVGLAGAIKVWPLALFPVLLHSATTRRSTWAGCALLLGVMTVLWAVPMVAAGLDQSSGLVVYAENWRTNGAMFSMLMTVTQISGLSQLLHLPANHVARGAIVLIVFAAGIGFASRRPDSALAVIQRAGSMAIVIFLLSPAQFPWYVVWIAPFLAFLPWPGLLLLAATMPLYYLAFYLMSIDAYALFNDAVIWVVWCPVWLLLILQASLQGPARRGQAAAFLTRRPGHDS